MLVSVIVPNHGRDLTELIESVNRSTYKNVEIVVVDEGKERSVQRNLGIARAKGYHFLILDSDQSVSPNLIAECVVRIRNGYSCCYIPEIIIAKSFFGKIRAFERTFYVATAVDVPRFVVRTHCQDFDESMTGPEDADWSRRIMGARTTTKSVLYHHDDISFIEYCKKKAYYTKSMENYIKKHPTDDCINIWYRCVTVFVENGKWRKLLKHPILSIGILFILITRGIIFYGNRTS